MANLTLFVLKICVLIILLVLSHTHVPRLIFCICALVLEALSSVFYLYALCYYVDDQHEIKNIISEVDGVEMAIESKSTFTSLDPEKLMPL